MMLFAQRRFDSTVNSRFPSDNGTDACCGGVDDNSPFDL